MSFYSNHSSPTNAGCGRQQPPLIAPRGTPLPLHPSTSSSSTSTLAPLAVSGKALHLGATTTTSSSGVGVPPIATNPGTASFGATSAGAATATLLSRSSLPTGLGNPLALPPYAPSHLPPLHHHHHHHHAMLLTASTNSKHTPQIFFNRKYRSGKWVPEEEQYAEALIELFEKGQVEECENGSTLRAYLSQKLHCAPMRISKKYAGKGIGKMVYLNKMKSGSAAKSDQEKVGELLKRVKSTEERFFRAVFPTSDAHMAPLGNFLPGSLHAVTPFPMLQGVMNLFPQATTHALPPIILPAALPISSLPTHVPQGTFLMPAAPIQPPSAANLVPQLNAAPPTHTVATNATTTSTSGHDDSLKADTEQLRRSFLSALQQNQQESQVSASNATAQNGPEANPVPGLQQYPGDWYTSVTAVKGTQDALHPGSRVLPEWANVHMAQAAPQEQFAAPPNQINEVASDLPDFVAGFDRAANRTTSRSLTDQLQRQGTNQNFDSQYSPPFTSRSFDDMHRFLGTDLTLLGEPDQAAAAAPTTEAAERRPSPAKPDTMALFTAESYALFAQESAMAASQHDAYLSTSARGIADHQKNNLFDIDGIVKLVSAHVDHHHQEQQQHSKQGAAAAMSAHGSLTTRQEQETATMTSLLHHTQPGLERSKAGTPVYLNMVSGSERSFYSSSGVNTETEISSFRGSTSESAGGTTGSDNTSNESEESNSDSDNGPDNDNDNNNNKGTTDRANGSLPSGPGHKEWNKRTYSSLEAGVSHVQKKARPSSSSPDDTAW